MSVPVILDIYRKRLRAESKKYVLTTVEQDYRSSLKGAKPHAILEKDGKRRPVIVKYIHQDHPSEKPKSVLEVIEEKAGSYFLAKGPKGVTMRKDSPTWYYCQTVMHNSNTQRLLLLCVNPKSLDIQPMKIHFEKVRFETRVLPSLDEKMDTE